MASAPNRLCHSDAGAPLLLVLMAVVHGVWGGGVATHAHSLRRTSIGDAGAQQIAAAVAKNKTLTSLECVL